MNIVFVIDQFNSQTNGTCATARRTAEQLEMRGHRVKVLSVGSEYAGETVKVQVIPGFQELINKQGFALAKAPSDAVYREAFADADLIHFFVPSPLGMRGLRIAQEMQIPTLGAFHIQAQNVSYNIGLGTSKRANDFIYDLFNRRFYKNFTHIHCPSNMIATQLREHNYEAELRVISNGVADFFMPIEIEKPVQFQEKFILLMVGRFSAEKRQDLLIEAMKYSKYSDKIQIIFAGSGPKDNELKKAVKSLENEPVFAFYNQEELRELYNICDLYIHCADAEIEGISCMEAIACGAVPVISNSKYSATQAFAIDENSIFEAGNAKDLAKHIDFYLDKPELRTHYSQEYAQLGASYHLENIINELEKLYLDVLVVANVQVSSEISL